MPVNGPQSRSRRSGVNTGGSPCGPFRIRAVEGIELDVLQAVAEAGGLFPSFLVQMAGQVSLQDVGRVLFRLAVSYQIKCRGHVAMLFLWCKGTKINRENGASGCFSLAFFRFSSD